MNGWNNSQGNPSHGDLAPLRDPLAPWISFAEGGADRRIILPRCFHFLLLEITPTMPFAGRSTPARR
jgi:hypothetical protein